MPKIIVVPGENDLATTHPELAEQFDLEKNAPLTPHQVTSGTARKFWWLCSKGHSWEASGDSRSLRGTGCPVCSNNRVLQGYNDLATTHPDLTQQFDLALNYPVKPTEVLASSGKKYWWKCSQGHAWQASGSKRAAGQGCSYCGNRKVLSGYNDLETVYPELGAEFSKALNSPLKASEVLAGTSRKYWWECSKGHTWQASPDSRTVRNTGCPVCRGLKVVVGYNDLQTTCPEAALEWDLEKNHPLSPTNYTAGSNKKVWWKCLRGHSWEATIASRTSKMRRGCPICANQKVLVGYNDLTTTHPGLLSEWDYEANSPLSPTEIVAGTVRVLHWKCLEYGHRWTAPGYTRVAGHGCPLCPTPVSEPEARLLEALQKLTEAVGHLRLHVPWRRNRMADVDILLLTLNTVVEYDGRFWHEKQLAKDISKTESLIVAGYKVVRVRADGLGFLPEVPGLYQVSFAPSTESYEDLASEIVNMIRKESKDESTGR